MKSFLIIGLFVVALSVGGVVAKNIGVFSRPSQADGLVPQNMAKATFAGGCFWCMEKPFETLDGVHSVISGYMGGTTKNPTYKNYEHGGHVEVVQITYDPDRVSFQNLLDVFWRQIDPTDAGGQFYDRGHAYSTGVYYHNKEQKQLAEKSKDSLSRSGIFKQPIVTPVLLAKTFWPAEKYHQDYYKKNPIRYKIYRNRSGRDAFLEKTWEKVAGTNMVDRAQLRNRLTPLQYKVTQEDGTEPPFKNRYWDNKEKGIYVDIVSGEPLFSSTEKYDSKTGWPSFYRPLVKENIVEVEDWSLFSRRIEVRSKGADSHLGHVFNDGPPPTGLRYCINSAALRFIPVDQLEEEGFAEYLHLFK